MQGVNDSSSTLTSQWSGMQRGFTPSSITPAHSQSEVTMMTQNSTCVTQRRSRSRMTLYRTDICMMSMATTVSRMAAV